MRLRRSLLFVPGTRPEAFGKALASGADVVCVDLEDAVPQARKAEARATAIPVLTAEAGPERVVRLNSLRSAEGLRALLAVIEARASDGTLMLPKVADAGEVRLAHDLLTEAGLPLRLAILVESAEGLENARAILTASDRIAFALFGAVDYAADMGLAHPTPLTDPARHRLLHAARLAGVDLLDVPCLDFRSEAAVTQEAQAARAMGFAGKAALHPANIGPINTAFAPSPDEVAEAEEIVALYDAAPTGLAERGGKLIEIPVVRAMRRRLALARAQKESA